MITLKCSSKTNPKALCKAIVKNYDETSCVEIEAVGAGAVNQAIKAIAYASVEMKKNKNYKLDCHPTLKAVNGNIVTVLEVI